MLENPATDSNAGPVKRYAPPNQRNRGLGRRKSGDRLERTNSYPNDGEKNQTTSLKNAPNMNSGVAGSSNRVSEINSRRLIPLHGCGSSEAFHLLNCRWAFAMNALNNLPEDSSERPVLYKSSASPWGHAILPHLMMSPAANPSAGLQKDFSSELQNAIRNANASFDAQLL